MVLVSHDQARTILVDHYLGQKEKKSLNTGIIKYSSCVSLRPRLYEVLHVNNGFSRLLLPRPLFATLLSSEDELEYLFYTK